MDTVIHYKKSVLFRFLQEPKPFNAIAIVIAKYRVVKKSLTHVLLVLSYAQIKQTFTVLSVQMKCSFFLIHSSWIFEYIELLTKKIVMLLFTYMYTFDLVNFLDFVQ